MSPAKRAAVLVLLSAPALARCMPDFDALSAGNPAEAGSPAGGAPIGGDSTGSSGESGSPEAGSSAAGTTAGGGSSGGASETGGDSANAGQAGATTGGAPDCSPGAGITDYSDFDTGLEGVGFMQTTALAELKTTNGATGSYEWDPMEGSRCPGALRFTYAFKAYASGAMPDEQGFGTYYFAAMDWTYAKALHAMVKVSPADAPIAGVRFFVLSNDMYRYTSVFDDTRFKAGTWQEMVLPLESGPYYDPTNVFRLGIQIDLLRAGTPGIPASAPTIEVWLDDIWLEPN